MLLAAQNRSVGPTLKAEIITTVSFIDQKVKPASMAAPARILNHLGQPSSFQMDGFDTADISLRMGDRVGESRLIFTAKRLPFEGRAFRSISGFRPSISPIDFRYDLPCSQ
tara:strand:- start:42387 stop:42719 length:333 start_codon:yes stop_codon:yes gene_type:complete